MNWLTFILASLLLMLVQLLLWQFNIIGETAYLFILLAFIGLNTPSKIALWAALFTGLLIDAVLRPHPVPDATTILGPAAVGCVVGMYALLQLRGLVFRESVLTLAVMTFVLGLFAELVIVALLAFRGMPWLTAEAHPDWSASAALAKAFLRLLITAAMAIPVGFVLYRSIGFWGFPIKGRSERVF